MYVYVSVYMYICIMYIRMYTAVEWELRMPLRD